MVEILNMELTSEAFNSQGWSLTPIKRPLTSEETTSTHCISASDLGKLSNAQMTAVCGQTILSPTDHGSSFEIAKGYELATPFFVGACVAYAQTDSMRDHPSAARLPDAKSGQPTWLSHLDTVYRRHGGGRVGEKVCKKDGSALHWLSVVDELLGGECLQQVASKKGYIA